MQIAAFAAIQAAFETALAYDDGNEDLANRLMDEFIGMAGAMDTILPDLTARGVRMGLMRLAWDAFQPEIHARSTSDTPTQLRSETASMLVKQLLVRYDAGDIERSGAAANEYLRQKELGLTPDVTMKDMAPSQFEWADFVKMVNYPDDGVTVSTVDLARVAVRAMVGSRTLPERWWVYAQLLVDGGRF